MLKWLNTALMEGAGDDGATGGSGGTGGQADSGNDGGDAGKGASGSDDGTILGSAGDKGGDQAGDKAGEWSWGEGIPGTGAVPDYFKADKYKTVGDQAKAAIELETKLGPAAELLGAPEGDYEMPGLPDGVEGEWDLNDSMLKTFHTVAKDMDLSQGTHDRIVQAMGTLLATEQSEAEVAVSDALAALGTNSAQRIEAVDTYMRSVVGDEGADAIDAAIGTNIKAYLAFETIVAAASGDAQLSNLPGKGGPSFSKADLTLEHFKEYPEGHNMAGQRIYDHDKEHRAKVDGMYKELFPGKDIEIVG